MASEIRSKGQRGDKILAHINPEEAHHLAQTQGMDINPHTGLPQYGFLGSLGRSFRGKSGPKWQRKILPKVLPVAGAVLGNMIMPGLGGSMLGGAIGGASSSGKHPLQHALAGAAMGAAGHYALGSGTTPEWMSKFGSKIGFAGEAGKKLVGKELTEKAATGWGDKIMKLMSDNPLETGLGAMGLIGTLFSKEKKQKGEGGHQEGSMQEAMAINRALQQQHNPPARQPKPMNRKVIQYSPEQWFKTSGELPYFEDINPQTEYYAEGGHVNYHRPTDDYGYAHGGYIDGDSGGQDDDVEIEMTPGSYVMDATTVGLLGDGHSKKGANLLKSWEEKALSSGIVNSSDYGHSHRVKAMVSPGETVLSPHFVTKIGKGSNDKGAKLLDKFRKRVRRHKGVKTFLPPKSKPINSYLKER